MIEGLTRLLASANQLLKSSGTVIEACEKSFPLYEKFVTRGYVPLQMTKDEMTRPIDLFHVNNHLRLIEKTKKLVMKTWQHERAEKNPRILISPVYGTKIDTSRLPVGQLEMRDKGVLTLDGKMIDPYKGFCRFLDQDQVPFSSCTVLRAIPAPGKLLMPDDASADENTYEEQFPVIDFGSDPPRWRLSNPGEFGEKERKIFDEIIRS